MTTNPDCYETGKMDSLHLREIWQEGVADNSRCFSCLFRCCRVSNSI